MKRAAFALGLLLAVVVALPARAADKEFDSLVNTLRHHYSLPRPEYPLRGIFMGPMMALARHSGDARKTEVEVATFENIQPGRFEPVDFENTVNRSLPSNWRPFVRVFSRKDHEITLVYMDTASTSQRMRLFIVTAEDNELTLVRVRVPDDQTMAWVDNPTHMAKQQAK